MISGCFFIAYYLDVGHIITTFTTMDCRLSENKLHGQSLFVLRTLGLSSEHWGKVPSMTSWYLL